MHSGSRTMSRSSSWSVDSGMVSSFIGVRPGAGRPTVSWSCLQVAIHEIDLLQPAKALSDVLRADLPHALDRLQLGVGRGEDLVQSAELADDVLHHELRQARDAPEDPVATRRDGEVEGVDLAVVAEQ